MFAVRGAYMVGGAVKLVKQEMNEMVRQRSLSYSMKESLLNLALR